MSQERDSSAGQNAANTPVSTVSFEEAQAILRQHGLRVSESDVEEVMLVALHGAFYHQTQKLLDRHNAVLTTVMGKSQGNRMNRERRIRSSIPSMILLPSFFHDTK